MPNENSKQHLAQFGRLEDAILDQLIVDFLNQPSQAAAAPASASAGDGGDAAGANLSHQVQEKRNNILEQLLPRAMRGNPSDEQMKAHFRGRDIASIKDALSASERNRLYNSLRELAVQNYRASLSAANQEEQKEFKEQAESAARQEEAQKLKAALLADYQAAAERVGLSQEAFEKKANKKLPKFIKDPQISLQPSVAPLLKRALGLQHEVSKQENQFVYERPADSQFKYKAPDNASQMEIPKYEKTGNKLVDFLGGLMTAFMRLFTQFKPLMSQFFGGGKKKEEAPKPSFQLEPEVAPENATPEQKAEVEAHNKQQKRWCSKIEELLDEISVFRQKAGIGFNIPAKRRAFKDHADDIDDFDDKKAFFEAEKTRLEAELDRIKAAVFRDSDNQPTMLPQMQARQRAQAGMRPQQAAAPAPRPGQQQQRRNATPVV